MNNFIKFFLVFLLCFKTVHSFSAPELVGSLGVGNGGDILICSENKPLWAEEIMFYDYADVLYYQRQHELRFANEFKPSRISNPEQLKPNEIELDVLNLLQQKNQRLADSYIFFLQYRMKNDAHRRIRWITDREQSIPFIHDEEATFEAKGCVDYQLVQRMKHLGYVEFTYNYFAMWALMPYPLQISMFSYHEWLWYYLRSAAKIREINFYLHSKDIVDDSKSEFNRKMRAVIDQLPEYSIQCQNSATDTIITAEVMTGGYDPDFVLSMNYVTQSGSVAMNSTAINEFTDAHGYEEYIFSDDLTMVSRLVEGRETVFLCEKY